MSTKTVIKSRKRKEISKKIILNLLSDLNPENQKIIFDLIYKSMNLNKPKSSNLEPSYLLKLLKIPQKKVLGFISLSSLLINQFGSFITEFLDYFHFFVSGYLILFEKLKEQKEKYPKLFERIKKIIKSMTRLLNQMFLTGENYEGILDLGNQILKVLSYKFETLQRKEKISNIFSLIEIISKNQKYLNLFINNKEIIPKISKMAKVYLKNIFLRILANLMSQNELEELMKENSSVISSNLFDILNKKLTSNKCNFILEILSHINYEKVEDIDKKVLVLIKLAEKKDMDTFKILSLVNSLILSFSVPKEIYDKLENLLAKIHGISNLKLLVECLVNTKINSKGNEVLQEITKVSQSIDISFDYDEIMEKFYFLNSQGLDNLDFEEIKGITLFCLNFASDSELSMKMAILEYFRSFFRKIKGIYNQEVNVQNFINNNFLPNLISKINQFYDQELETFQPFVKVVNEYLLFLGDIDILNEDTQFYSDAKELTDNEMLESLISLKLSQVLNKIVTLNKILKSKIFSEVSIIKIFLPILLNILLIRCDSMRNKNRKESSQNISYKSSLVQIGSVTFSLLASQLKWPEYKKLIIKLIGMLKSTNYSQKTLTKIISAVLTEIPLKLFDIVEMAEKKLESFQLESEFTERIEINDEEFLNHQEKEIQKELDLLKFESSQENSDLNFLRKSVLIPLRVYMVEKGKAKERYGKIRVYLAIALVKVLTKMTPQVFRIEFPKIITTLVSHLKSGDKEIRNDARGALQEICFIVGPPFIEFVFRECSKILREGFNRHVLNYTVFSILQLMIEDKDCVKVGQLDYALESILVIVNEEIFGTLSEEKSTGELKNKGMEIKKKTGNSCYSLLGKVISFDIGVPKLISILDQELQNIKATTKTVAKCQECLNNLRNGLIKNETLSLFSILALTISLCKNVESKLFSKKEILATLEERDVKEIYSTRKGNKEKNLEIQDCAAEGKSIFKENAKKRFNLRKEADCVFSIFSLQLLVNFFKRNEVDDEDFQKLFEQLLPVIKSFLNADIDELYVLTCEIFVVALKKKVPVALEMKHDISQIILKNLPKVSIHSQDSSLFQATYRMLKCLLENFSEQGFFNEDQLRAISLFLQENLLVSEEVPEPLECLLEIVSRKIILPNIYDLMDSIVESMISTYSKKIQNLCKNIFSLFLIEYPLTDVLFEKYLYTLLRNLHDSQYNSKRCIIDIFDKIFFKLPKELIGSFEEIMFLNFCTCLTNEEDEEIKECLQNIGFKLFSTLSPKTKSNFIEKIGSWLNHNDFKIQKTGLEATLMIKDSISSLLHALKNTYEEITKNCLIEKEEFFEKIKKTSELRKKMKESKFKGLLNEEDNPEEELAWKESLLTLLNVLKKFSGSELLLIDNDIIHKMADLSFYPDRKIKREILNLLSSFENLILDENRQMSMIKLLKTDFADSENAISQIYQITKHLTFEIKINSLQMILKKSLADQGNKMYVIEGVTIYFNHLFREKKLEANEEQYESALKCILRIKSLETQNMSALLDETIERMEKHVGSSSFFKLYSSAKSSLEKLKKARKSQVLQDKLLDPEGTAILKEKKKEKLRFTKKKKAISKKLGYKVSKLSEIK